MSQQSHTGNLATGGRLAKLGLHAGVYALPLAMSPDGWPLVLISLGLAVLLIWISLVDLERFEIPDVASALLIMTGLGVTAALDGPVLVHLVGGLIWGGVFAGLALAYLHWRGFDGLGLGDAKLMIGIGAWLGPVAPASVVLAAAVSGIGFILLMRRGARQSPIAFGPFLCFFAWVVWLFRPVGI